MVVFIEARRSLHLQHTNVALPFHRYIPTSVGRRSVGTRDVALPLALILLPILGVS